jgi:hypothetical protein
MRFICPELLSQDTSFQWGEHDLFKKDTVEVDSVNDGGIVLLKLHKIKTQSGTNDYVLYAPAFVKKYSESFSIPSNLMTIAEFITAMGLTSATLFNNTGLTTQKFYWGINKYGEIGSSFFYTILTDSGIWLTKPKRLSGSTEITKFDIIGNYLDFNTSVKFEGETGGDYKISYDADKIIPTIIDSTLKALGTNKKNSLNDYMIITSGQNVDPLSWFSDGGRYYVVMSKKEIADGKWAYLAVLEQDITYSFSGANINPVIPTNGNPARLRVYRSAALTAGAASDTIFPYDTVEIDNYGAFTVGASANYVIPYTGWYKMIARYGFTKTADTNQGRFAIWIRKTNGPAADIAGKQNLYYSNSGGQTANGIDVSAIEYLTKGDVISIRYNLTHAYAFFTGRSDNSFYIEGE